jgi:hypothetical protein
MWCALVLVLLIAATASASPISNPQRGNAATQTDTSAQAANERLRDPIHYGTNLGQFRAVPARIADCRGALHMKVISQPCEWAGWVYNRCRF